VNHQFTESLSFIGYLFLTMGGLQIALLRSLAFKGMNNRIHVIAENHKETLNWIWSEDGFLRWKEKNSGVFWVTGKPGSGKSTLLKHVFNEQKKDSSAVFAGFFFNDRGGGGLVNSFKGFLQAILHQILSQMPVPSIYRCLIPLYKKQLEEEKSQEGFEWPIPTLRKCLLEILGGTTESPIYIFIDALDECEVNPRERLSDEYSMLAFLEDICRFRHSNDHELRVFVTSRYDGRINTMMERINGAGKGYFGSIRLEKLSGKDMETYVSDQVLTLKLPERFQEVVREELLSRAQGVFLWVRLVIYDLRGCAQYLDSADEIKKVLDSIPDELDDLYSRLLMKVGSNLLHKTETMLRWVLFAKRPLTLEEFGYAIAIRSFERQFSSIEDIEAWIPPSQSQETIKSTIQTLSGGLLEIVSRHENQGGGSLVQLIHQSAREFLISRPRMVSGVEMRLAKSISNAHITDVCISYLKLSRPCQQSNDKHRGIDSFISYAGQHWPAHLHDASSSGYLSTYSDAESKEEMEMEPKRTFLNAQNFIFSRSASFWISAFQYGRNPVEIAYEEKFHRIIKNGMERKFKFDLPDYDVEVLEGAVALGYEEIVREVLLKSEKDPNVLKPHSDRYWAALYTATIKGYEGIVQLLMQHKANVKAHCGECGNALYDAKIKGLERMTRILIKNGANFHPQPKGTEYRRALYSTKYLRDLSMIRFLVENGADVNPQYRIYRNRTSISKSHNIPPQEHLSSPQMELSVLQNAIWENSTVDAVKILIDGGADINAPDGILGNALTIAVKKLNLEIVQLLVENGVNIDAQGGEYGNALQAASTKGMEIVKYLVENGANIKVKGGKYGGALQAAAYHQNWDVLRFLVQNGADINASGPYGSILQIAAYRNDKKTFEFLMKNGVDINAQGSGYGNALQAAATGSLNIVEVLYKAGLDVNTQGGYYGNALQAAAHRGDESIFLFLIDKKANVHAQGGRYGTALQAAAQRGRSRIVDLLIHKLKVDVNVQGGFYHTALQAACAAVRDRGVVDLLVHKGAEVNARGGKYNTALQAAALRNLDNVELLIENGADVNAQGGYFGNALQAAATRNLGTVEFLILNGADVNAQGGHHGNALQAAKANGKSSIVRLLLQHGAKWGTENSDASITTYIPVTPIQAEDRGKHKRVTSPYNPYIR
jgi:ankyrin repeat protein